jgi:hypothetical protein
VGDAEAERRVDDVFANLLVHINAKRSELGRRPL